MYVFIRFLWKKSLLAIAAFFVCAYVSDCWDYHWAAVELYLSRVGFWSKKPLPGQTLPTKRWRIAHIGLYLCSEKEIQRVHANTDTKSDCSYCGTFRPPGQSAACHICVLWCGTDSIFLSFQFEDKLRGNNKVYKPCSWFFCAYVSE